jgi:hypothetical protein
MDALATGLLVLALLVAPFVFAVVVIAMLVQLGDESAPTDEELRSGGPE